MKIDNIKKIHFIGIGGIGMSALARYFHGKGASVTGYDRHESELTKAMLKQGIKVHFEDDASLIPAGVDLVVWTPAMPANSPQLAYAKAKNLPMKKRAEVLGLISNSQKMVAIGGTHGKTSTSAMAMHLFRNGGVDATAFLGGIAVNLETNFVQGKSEWVIAEADEYDRSFLQLTPDIAVINSVDADHLDIYGSEEAVIESYAQFARQVKPGGILLYKAGQPLPRPEGNIKIYTFGYNTGDYQAQNWKVEGGYSHFDLRTPKGTFKDLKMRLPGKYNLENATAAIACAMLAGVKADKIRFALSKFKGVKRRFEYWLKPEKGEKFDPKAPILIDDYAHHPAEIEATIEAVRSLFPGKKITGIFQPHLFSRTKDFADGFAEALGMLDRVILLPIYPAREEPVAGVNSDMLLSKIKNVEKFSTSKEGLFNIIKPSNVEVVLTLGAGDIDELLPQLRKHLSK